MKNNKSVGGEIPIQILKESEFTFEILTNCINKSIETGCFPDSLKEANITPIFKKDDPLDKSNYRPVSILPLISKVYERLIYNQLSEYTESFLSHIILSDSSPAGWTRLASDLYFKDLFCKIHHFYGLFSTA